MRPRQPSVVVVVAALWATSAPLGCKWLRSDWVLIHQLCRQRSNADSRTHAVASRTRREQLLLGVAAASTQSLERPPSAHAEEGYFEFTGAGLLRAAEYGFRTANSSLEKFQTQGHIGNRQPVSILEAIAYSLRHFRLVLGTLQTPPPDALAQAEEADALLQVYQVKGLQVAMSVSERLLSLAKLRQSEVAKIVLRRPLLRTLPYRIPPLGSEQMRTPRVELQEGVKMPLLGFGTGIFSVPLADVERVVLHAARDLGYRHFDCAQNYGTEAAVGRALESSGVPRADLFLATKLSEQEDLGSEETPALVMAQLAKLRVSYVDLYMLHTDFRDELSERKAWQALETLHAQGRIRALGLCNYDVAGIERILAFAKVLPSVLQIKYDVYHPGYQWAREGQPDVVTWAKGRGITVVGYSTLSGWPSVLQPIVDPNVRAVADRCGRSPGEVLLRHSLQKGLAVIPSSTNIGHLRRNCDVFDFELTANDVALLDGLAHFPSLAQDGAPTWVPDVFGARNL